MGAVKPAEFDERYAAAVPSSWEESVVSGAIANRFAISRPLLKETKQPSIKPQLFLKLGGIECKPVRCNSSRSKLSG
jgi:hypothetical protein